ncbi:Consortin [Apodemus speciosus]|uniref:Consortin n=1 Tax=Apodemus speciosus TaxID=105296 RepID=A0ABQ0EFY1_APOSI
MPSAWKDFDEPLNSSTKDALMDDSDSPTYSLQIQPQDGCCPGDSVERGVTHLPSVSDENENQLAGDGPARLTTSDSAMGRATVSEQDSLNNNEGFPSSCEAAPTENPENTPSEGLKDDPPALGQDKKLPAKRSPKAKKGTPKSAPPGDGDAVPVMQTLNAASQADDEEEAAGVNVNDPPKAPALQPLFSLIRGEVGQMDSRALPLFLHQVAETYFQEEDYEKAMKFIQLERLYHEQLLANLSAIQEQWETKWKAVQPRTVTPLRNSEKGFNGEDFEQLAKICTTHQDPLLSKLKIAPVEQSPMRKSFPRATASEEPAERGATAKEPVLKPVPAMDASGGRHEEEPQESSCHQMDWQGASPDLPGTAGKDRTEELPCSTSTTLELRTQPPETAGSRLGPAAAASACEKDSCEPAPPTEDHPDVAPPCESVAEPQLSQSDEVAPPGLISEGKYSQTHRKELCLPLQDKFEALPRDQPRSEVAEPGQPDVTASDGKSAQLQAGLETGPESALCGDGKASDISTLCPEVCMAPEERRDSEDQVSKETEDYLNSLLEGCLKDAEDSLSYEDIPDDDSDLLQDLSPEEASYSLQENLPPEESTLSLDDLAKKIEIAEAVPAEGLVSILKKRNDTVGGHPAQMQQKPAKRRVRFQEIDDSLDQDDVGGGSCILLILLCIATVFLSVGGTALYCTLGDMESPVCTDFADNVDFYYSKLLQGVAGLKHWVYLS